MKLFLLIYYDLIAKNICRLIGKKDNRMMSKPEIKERFLD